MPTSKQRVKRETSLPKVTSSGRLKETEWTECGSSMVSECLPSSGNACPSVAKGSTTKAINGPAYRKSLNFFVPVFDANQRPLMPTKLPRALRWAKLGKATPFYRKGLLCVRLNVEPSARKTQDISVGVDPGSKEEGFTVKSASHTYWNFQAKAVTWVKDAVKTRREMRRGRRNRKTPCRRPHQVQGRKLPPSTKARWQWKLRILRWVDSLVPSTKKIVEDIKAKTKGKRRWDRSFSPLEVGKKWFYEKLESPELKRGYETKELRDALELKKNYNKRSRDFHAHCVDSWVLANSQVGGHTKPDNTSVIYLTPLRFHRRQLHKLQSAKGNVRRREGSTMSLGLKRGSLVKYPKYGLCYIGGTMNGRISLHSIFTSVRLCQNAKVEDCRFRTYLSWTTLCN